MVYYYYNLPTKGYNMKYFSLDYRSPPSGMGQIVDTSQPERIINGIGKEVWNYILVTYSGCGSENDPNYILTAHFRSLEAEKQGWCGPILEDLINYLRTVGVTKVYDIELSYDEEGADEDGYFPLDRWGEIMMSFL
tara:strand:- start:121 stop:528 length:408 start_codon:yes stop_codon:yes gene_type:complete